MLYDKQKRCSNALLISILIAVVLIVVLMYTITAIVIIKLPDIIVVINNTTRSIDTANGNIVALIDKINNLGFK